MFTVGTVISIHQDPSMEFTEPIAQRLRHRTTGLRQTADASLLVESLIDLGMWLLLPSWQYDWLHSCCSCWLGSWSHWRVSEQDTVSWATGFDETKYEECPAMWVVPWAWMIWTVHWYSSQCILLLVIWFYTSEHLSQSGPWSIVFAGMMLTG